VAFVNIAGQQPWTCRSKTYGTSSASEVSTVWHYRNTINLILAQKVEIYW